MKVYRILPDKSIRYGLIEAVSQFPEICAIEFGPEGTMHYLSEAVADRSDNVFTSGIKEKDIIWGTTKILEQAAIDADRRKHPSYMILVSSCVTEIIGTDLSAVAKKLQSQLTAKKVLAMDHISFTADESDGWILFSKMMADQIIPELPAYEKKKGSYNLLGISQTDFHGKADRRELKRMLSDYMGMECLNTENGGVLFKNLATAQFNLVVRQEAVPLAQALEQRFGTPYILACPYGVQQCQTFLKKIGVLCGVDYEKNPIYQEELQMAKRASMYLKSHLRSIEDFSVVLHGTYDKVSSLQSFLKNECMLNRICAVNSSNFKGEDNNIERKKSEAEFISMMKEKRPYLLISHEVYCDYFREISKGFTMFTPTIHRTDLNEFAPYMGMRGIINLSQDMVNAVSCVPRM